MCVVCGSRYVRVCMLGAAGFATQLRKRGRYVFTKCSFNSSTSCLWLSIYLNRLIHLGVERPFYCVGLGKVNSRINDKLRNAKLEGICCR